MKYEYHSQIFHINYLYVITIIAALIRGFFCSNLTRVNKPPAKPMTVVIFFP